jgi:hypothetical protein
MNCKGLGRKRSWHNLYGGDWGKPRKTQSSQWPFRFETSNCLIRIQSVITRSICAKRKWRHVTKWTLHFHIKTSKPVASLFCHIYFFILNRSEITNSSIYCCPLKVSRHLGGRWRYVAAKRRLNFKGLHTRYVPKNSAVRPSNFGNTERYESRSTNKIANRP